MFKLNTNNKSEPLKKAVGNSNALYFLTDKDKSNNNFAPKSPNPNQESVFTTGSVLEDVLSLYGVSVCGGSLEGYFAFKNALANSVGKSLNTITIVNYIESNGFDLDLNAIGGEWINNAYGYLQGGDGLNLGGSGGNCGGGGAGGGGDCSGGNLTGGMTDEFSNLQRIQDLTICKDNPTPLELGGAGGVCPLGGGGFGGSAGGSGNCGDDGLLDPLSSSGGLFGNIGQPEPTGYGEDVSWDGYGGSGDLVSYNADGDPVFSGGSSSPSLSVNTTQDVDNTIPPDPYGFNAYFSTNPTGEAGFSSEGLGDAGVSSDGLGVIDKVTYIPKLPQVGLGIFIQLSTALDSLIHYDILYPNEWYASRGLFNFPTPRQLDTELVESVEYSEDTLTGMVNLPTPYQFTIANVIEGWIEGNVTLSGGAIPDPAQLTTETVQVYDITTTEFNEII